jgi:hypothetical protein
MRILASRYERRSGCRPAIITPFLIIGRSWSSNQVGLVRATNLSHIQEADRQGRLECMATAFHPLPLLSKVSV